MKTYIFLTFCLILSFSGFGQLFDQYGIYVQRNASTQQVDNP